MKQLTGLDATFLHLENATQFGHVSGLSIFSRPETEGYDPYAAWRGAARASGSTLLEPLRRRLVEVPLGLDHPSGSTTPTSTWTSTSATRRCRRPAATTSWRDRQPRSSRGRWTGAGRCGCPTSSRGWPTTASRC